MKEKELTSKELLVQKLGMEFDEVAPIFSEETLTSMTMSHVVGGAGETNPGCTFPGCTVNPGCSYSGCSNNTTGDDCKSNVKTCEQKLVVAVMEVTRILCHVVAPQQNQPVNQRILPQINQLRNLPVYYRENETII